MNEPEIEDLDEELQRWVTFELDGEVYGISVSEVREVLRYSDIAPVPGSPSFVIGIINLRGNVVTVIDTRSRFGLTPKEVNDDTRIIIIDIEDQEVGILVDSVSEVVDLDANLIEAAPNVGSEETSRYIKGVTSMEGSLLILVDVSKLLTDEELADLSNGF